MKTLDLRKNKLDSLKIGDKVITSKGFTFVKTKVGYKDIKSKLSWYYPEKEKMNHYQAMEKFPGPKHIPTKEEFELAEKHGFREVLNITSGYYWSSSVSPNNTDNAYYFNGGSGGIGFDYRVYDGAALCVSGR